MISPESIREVLIEQQDELSFFKNSKFIKRENFEKAKVLTQQSWIKVITGIRRCGKSVFAHQLLENIPYVYVNFDDERLIGLTSKDLNIVLQIIHEIAPGVKTLLFDEIQNVEKWELFANRLHRQGYHLIITGSNSKLLSKELATHLTGRHIIIPLCPFSYREKLTAQGIEWNPNDFHKTEKKAQFLKILTQYTSEGGFPEMVTAGFHPEYLRNLYDKIITRDITSRYGIRYGTTLKELALYSFSNLGSRLTYHKIKNIFEMSSIHTVKNYLQYLEDAYLLKLMKPFSFKIKEQIRQPRKVYTIDNGLSHAISTKFTKDIGASIENLVAQELERREKSTTYYSGQDFEVDFVIRVEREIQELIQVSYSLENPDTKKRELTGLIKAAELTKCQNLQILTWNEEAEEKIGKHKIRILPLWKWLLLND